MSRSKYLAKIACLLLTLCIDVYSNLFSSSLSKTRQLSSIKLTTGVFQRGLLRNVIRASKIQSWFEQSLRKKGRAYMFPFVGLIGLHILKLILMDFKFYLKTDITADRAWLGSLRSAGWYYLGATSCLCGNYPGRLFFKRPARRRRPHLSSTARTHSSLAWSCRGSPG